MSLESTAPKPKNISSAALGMIIGAGIALLLSELGLEVEMSVGFILGLSIGVAIDKRKKTRCNHRSKSVKPKPYHKWVVRMRRWE